MSWKYQKCNACETVFTDKTEIDVCPICRGTNFTRKDAVTVQGKEHKIVARPRPQSPKIKIESIEVFAQYDESPDTSYLGEYTDKESDWCIDRASGEFCCKIRQRERIIEALEEKIYQLQYDYTQDGETNQPDEVINKQVSILQKRIEKIRNSGATEITKQSREYSFFLPAQHVPHNPENWSHVQGKEREAVIKEFGSIKNNDLAYAMQDYKRMEDLNNGGWSYIGIIAKAKILIPSNIPQSAQYQTISSSGLWGIESDSGDDYFKEVIEEELHSLAGQLEALGIGKRSIQYAIKQCSRELIWK